MSFAIIAEKAAPHGGKMRIRDLGKFLLAVWLVLYGLNAIVRLDAVIRGDVINVVLGAIALVAGILLLIRR
jgi:hypothetical protein